MDKRNESCENALALVSIARAYIGKTTYKFKADIDAAPIIVDCSSFVKWIYLQIGIVLPRHSFEQRMFGYEIGLSESTIGDLVFATNLTGNGVRCKFHGDYVGHVGIISSPVKDVIHAPYKIGVTEVTFENFLIGRSYRGIRRILHN